MSAFVLKLIAVVSMLIDHASYILNLSGFLRGGTSYVLLRAVGRVAFVIFAYLIANGLEKTSDPRRYFSRLIFFAVISQPAFSMAFSYASYADTEAEAFSVSFAGSAVELAALALIVLCYWLFACRRRADLSVLWLTLAFVFAYARVRINGVPVLGDDLNVFYTLALSLAVCTIMRGVLDKSLDRGERLRRICLLLAAAASAALMQQRADYGFMGVILICAFYAVRKSRAGTAAVGVVWCVCEYWLRLGSLLYTLFAMLALIPILLYNGERGKGLKLGFYLVYPVHLYLFRLIGSILSH